MEKKLIFLTVSLALLAPAGSGAQPIFSPAAGRSGLAGSVMCEACPAGGALQSGAAGYFKNGAIGFSSLDRIPAYQQGEGEFSWDGAFNTGPLPKKMSIYEAVSLMEGPEDFNKNKKTILRRGGGDIKTSFLITVPKSRWRIIWRLWATDKKENASFMLRAEPAGGKADNVHEITKDMGTAGAETFGLMNICDEEGGKFRLTLRAKKVKWEIEVQSIYD